MKINKRDIENVMETLNNLLEDMKANELEEISTNCNTYGLYKFISFGRNGYLTLNPEELYEKVTEEE